MSKKKEIREFAKEFHITYPTGQERGIAEALGAKSIPETFFISRDGRIINKITDTIHYSQLSVNIDEILK